MSLVLAAVQGNHASVVSDGAGTEWLADGTRRRAYDDKKRFRDVGYTYTPAYTENTLSQGL